MTTVDITDVDPSTLDSFHYGYASMCDNGQIMSFIDKCVSKLPQKNLPIAIGWTGYVNPKRGNDLGSYGDCWCLDSCGRHVIVLGEYLIFQRYNNTGNIMISPISGWSYRTLEPSELPNMYNLIKVT